MQLLLVSCEFFLAVKEIFQTSVTVVFFQCLNCHHVERWDIPRTWKSLGQNHTATSFLSIPMLKQSREYGRISVLLRNPGRIRVLQKIIINHLHFLCTFAVIFIAIKTCLKMPHLEDRCYQYFFFFGDGCFLTQICFT